MNKLTKKRGKALFMLLIVLLLPIAQVSAQSSSSLEEIGRRTANIPEDIRSQAEAIGDEFGELGAFGVPGTIGEDIILQVVEYQPRIIRSSLLEDQGVIVHALLTGQPTNPTITVPRIRNVVIRRQKVTTVPFGAPVSVGRVSHVNPLSRDLTYDNMGYMVVPIRQIPRENDVPDEIIIDVDARVFFDVSEGLTFGPMQDILTEQSHNDWLLTKEDHSFYGGYVGVSEIKDNKATIILYDDNLNEIRGSPVTVSVGQTSRSLRSAYGFGYAFAGRLFDQFNIKLNKITELGDKVRLLVTQQGKTTTVTLSEGEFLYPGSSWFVDRIITDIQGQDLKVRLRNRQSNDLAELEAKKLAVRVPPSPTPPAAQPQKQPAPQGKAGEEEYKELYKQYDLLVKGSDGLDGYKDYSKVIDAAFAFLEDTAKTKAPEVERDILTLLKVIQKYYQEKALQRLQELNREIPAIAIVQESINEKTKSLTERLDAYTKGKAPVGVAREGSTEAGALAYSNALEEYEQFIAKYTASTDKEIRRNVAKAHWNIANLPSSVGGKELAIAHLETLLNEFVTDEYPVPKNTIELLLTTLKNLRSDFESASKELSEPTTSEKISVLLVSAETPPLQLRSKATLEMEGVGTRTLYEGQQLAWDVPADPSDIVWIVKEIGDKYIKVSQPDGTNEIQLNLNVPTGTSLVIKRTPELKRTVRLIGVDAKKEAHITISPNIERAFSEAIFTLHLPIDKRALDLPLFSSTVEEEIAKTEELLDKLDTVVENVRKITEYWQKFCIITFGVLWAKNFATGIFGGGKDAAARGRVRETFREKYTAYQLLPTEDAKSCKGLTYDQCVLKNQQEYEAAIESSKTIIEQMHALDDKYYKTGEFGDLGKEYDSIKDELFYYEKFSAAHPTDREARFKYLEMHARLRNTLLEQNFQERYFQSGKIKNYNQLDKTLVAETLQSETMVESYNELYSKLTAKEKAKEDEEVNKIIYSTIIPGEFENRYNNYLWETHKDRLIPHFKEVAVKKDLEVYFEAQKTKYPGYEKEIDNLAKGYRIGERDASLVGTFEHEPVLTFFKDGRQKDNAEFISLDPFHYLQVTYRTSGRVEKYELFRRSSPNGPMGHPTDVYLGVVDEQLKIQYGKGDDAYKELAKKLSNAQNCISAINKKQSSTRYTRGEKVSTTAIGCTNLGTYTVSDSVDSYGPSCTDFMTPTDCKILFNACDPVICPTSRCNLAGDWPVDNVVETGIIGSTLLCLPNWVAFGSPGGVVMPVCLTGIHAGLQNLRSIIQGYHQCLITAKTQGRSVGICDRIRSFGICEVLWKEGIAIVSAKKGIVREVVKLFSSGDVRGGGEYGNFDQTLDEAGESLKFFTQSYAKNTFARYSGGSLPEIGTEICKAAIFRKAPGVGNIFDQITRPESPPQFNAFFDVAPYSDISDPPLSQYKIFYHIYAGENEQITYSVYLQAKDPYTGQLLFRPQFVRDDRGIVRGRSLPPGAFASESPDLILPAGYDEICVEINSLTYGRNLECGFGKVSTGFTLNYLTDQFTQNELNKRVNSAEECVSQTSTITPELLAGELSGAAVGTVGTIASGFTSTGIVRKCSKITPGIGGDEAKWSPVGSCGEDERGRDLGTCWLYLPTARNLIQQVSARTEFTNTLNETALRVIREAEEAGKPIPGFYTLTKEQIAAKLKEAEGLLAKAKGEDETAHLQAARALYREIMAAFDIREQDAAKAHFLLAESYEEEARILVKKEAMAKAIEGYKAKTNLNERGIDKGEAVEAYMAEEILVEYIFKGQQHTFTVKNMQEETVTLVVESRHREFILKKGEPKQIDIDRDGKDDIIITYTRTDYLPTKPGEDRVIGSVAMQFKLVNPPKTPVPEIRSPVLQSISQTTLEKLPSGTKHVSDEYALYEDEYELLLTGSGFEEYKVTGDRVQYYESETTSVQSSSPNGPLIIKEQIVQSDSEITIILETGTLNVPGVYDIWVKNIKGKESNKLTLRIIDSSTQSGSLPATCTVRGFWGDEQNNRLQGNALKTVPEGTITTINLKATGCAGKDLVIKVKKTSLFSEPKETFNYMVLTQDENIRFRWEAKVQFFLGRTLAFRGEDEITFLVYDNANMEKELAIALEAMKIVPR